MQENAKGNANNGILATVIVRGDYNFNISLSNAENASVFVWLLSAKSDKHPKPTSYSFPILTVFYFSHSVTHLISSVWNVAKYDNNYYCSIYTVK